MNLTASGLLIHLLVVCACGREGHGVAKGDAAPNMNPVVTADRIADAMGTPEAVGPAPEALTRPARPGLTTGYGGIEGFTPSFEPTTPRAAMDAALDAKAKTRAMNAMRKRQLQEEMTGEPQPGPSYEELLEDELEAVRAERDAEIKAARQRREARGMSSFDVLFGKASPTARVGVNSRPGTSGRN